MAEIEAAIRSVPIWYHTMELAPGKVTPGWFDLRPIVAKMPWPDVRGKRCIDIGTYDGFLAFELEARGAAEVVAVDISDHTQWDWPYDMEAQGPENLAKMAGKKGEGFRVAKEARGSRVVKIESNVYDLSPTTVGAFDVVVCGSLMLHLRDPLRALRAIRSITTDALLSSETIDLALTAMHPKRPVSVLNGMGGLCQWSIPNAAGHRRMVMASGFSIEATSRPYTIPYGVAHPPRGTTFRHRVHEGLQTVIAGGAGVPHAAVLGRPI